MQETVQYIHKNIRVFGRVQGVGFRFACRKTAVSFGIKGFVRNLHDGSVYIEAEGPATKVTYFINWCHEGPQHASITEVRITDGPMKDFNYFDITA